MDIRRNYFIIKGPVPPNLFFDRKKEVEFLENLLNTESYGLLISIIAPFRFGKTSLLKKYMSIMKRYGSIIPVYLPSKLRSDPIKIIKSRLSDRIPEAANIIIDDRNDPAIFFRKINNLLEKHDLWIILVIDEFQKIPHVLRIHGYVTNWSNEDVFDFFRGVTEEYRFGLIVSGSYIGELIDAISVWNGRFIESRLGPFPREDSIIMLKTFFEKSGLEVNDDIVEYIAMSVGDHPYYMQLFGYKLVEIGSVDEEALKAAKEFVMKKTFSLFRRKYKELKKQGKEFVDILIRISEGSTSINEYSDEEWELLWDLERMGVIYDYGTRVQIPDKLFARFIMNIASNREPERIIPEYTTEYIVARELAYKEGFREVLISFRSWGPFAIAIMRRLGNYRGIGIQVKSTTSNNIKIPRTELRHVIKTAKELELIPIFAVFFKTENEIRYFIADTAKIAYYKNEGIRRLCELLKQ